MRSLIFALLLMIGGLPLKAAEMGPRCLAELEWLAKQAFEKPKNLEEAFRAGPFEPPVVANTQAEPDFVVSKQAETQRCFDAGMARLRGLWPEEAERCFRHATMLDESCAMAWWGLAAANERFPGRGQFFMEKALALTKSNSPEKAWLEVWDAFFRPTPGFTMSEHLMKHAVRLAEGGKLVIPWAKTQSESLSLRWEVMAGLRGSGMPGVREKLGRIFASKKDQAWIWSLALMQSPAPESREMQLEAARRVAAAEGSTPNMLRLAAEVLRREGDLPAALKAMETAIHHGLRHAASHFEPVDLANDWTSHAVTYASWLAEAGRHAEAAEVAKRLIGQPRRPRFTARGDLDDKANEAFTSGRRLLASLYTRRRDWQGLRDELSNEWLADSVGLMARADGCYWRTLAAAALRDAEGLATETSKLEAFLVQTREAAFLNVHGDEVAALVEGAKTLAGRMVRRGVFVAKPVRDVPVEVVRTPLGSVTALDQPAPKTGVLSETALQAPELILKDHEGVSHDLRSREGKWTLVIFFLGHGCVHCTEQLRLFSPLMPRFADLGLETWAVSTDSVSDLNLTLGGREPDDPPLPFLVLSDEKQAGFETWHCHDAFLKKAMHGTFLVNPKGAIVWSDISHEPYSQPEFLVEECGRQMRLHQK